MGGLFGGGAPSVDTSYAQEQARAAAEAQRKRMALARGRESTVLAGRDTGGEGGGQSLLGSRRTLGGE